MKMQNIIKSEKAGKVKSVKVKAGDSVTVDQLLIEFEWVYPIRTFLVSILPL